MNYGQYIFSLELNNPNSQVALSAKRTDTGRKLYINLTQNGEPYLITDECWVLFMATKSDGTKIVHECSVVNNVVEYDLQEQTVASIGVMNCAIAVYGTVNNVAKKLESAMFNIVVYDSSIDIDEVTSSDDYQAFISATGELKNLMLECETLLNTYAAQLSTINNSLKVLAQSNSIDLMQSIPSFQEETGVLTYRWELDSKVFTLSSNTTEERNILIGTLVLNEQTVNLDIQGANNNVSVRCTLTLHSGATVTNTVVKSEVIELNNSQFKAAKIEVCKASGYRGSSQIKITCETAPTNRELHKQIKLINKQLEEGGGVGADGKSAYEIWLEQGNEGTEAEFIASLKGEQGEQGEQGIQGIQGEKGADGAKGDKGDKGDKGEQGEQGEQGEKGEKGEDGTSVTITEIEHITSVDSPTTHIITFSDGTTLSIEDGERGAKGDKGDKGDSYTLTEDDKDEINSEIKDEVENQLDGAKADIVTELITQIGGMPVFGTVSDDNTITLTSMLADGVYTMVYENEEGIIEEITSFTVGNGDKPNVNEYEVDVAKVGYTDNARWSVTDGAIRTAVTGYTAINKIPFERTSGQTVTINLSGITWTDSALATQYASILLYVDDSYTTGNNLYLKELPKDFIDVGVRAVLNEDNSITITIYDGSNGTMFNGFKLCGVGSGANAKITITIG